MNSRQREYLKYTLGREEFFIESLKRLYQDALDDINTRIADLRGRSDLENLQSIIYQLNYQQSLRKQVNAILDDLHGKEYLTMEDYLRECYDNGFIGTMYDLHGQGIPLVLPIDQDNVLRSLTINSKLSKSLYESLGEDISKLKNKVRINISRGFASNMSFAEITRNIANMSKIGINNAIRIARTEGHRIQTEATMDAQQEAKNNGADIVKQWDATLDGRTRPSHRKLDGQIRELDDYFEVNGHKAKAPHHFGIASEDINCRCALLQRAKWALDDDGTITKMDNEKKEIIDIKAKDYNSFKNKYFKELDKQKELEKVLEAQKKEQIKLTNRLEKNKNIIATEVSKGLIKLDVNPEKQNRHILGTKEYKNTKSYIYGDINAAKELIKELSGTGALRTGQNGVWKRIEYVKYNKPIGVAVYTKYDDENHMIREEYETNEATIHYSKTGTHIVPRKGKNK